MDHAVIYSEMRPRLIELCGGVLYMLRLRFCALKDRSEALVIIKFGIFKAAKVTMELKPVIWHELDD